MNDNIETVRRTTEKLRTWLRTDDDTMEGAEDCDTILAALEHIEAREKALADALEKAHRVVCMPKTPLCCTDPSDVDRPLCEYGKLLANRAPSEQAAKARVFDRLRDEAGEPDWLDALLAEELAGDADASKEAK